MRPGPLFFHHIPKTGGTSLTEAIRTIVPERLCFTGHNWFLPLPLVELLVRDGLSPAQFIHGHPGYGVGEALRGKTRMITVLREPAQQIVSHYLAILRDPGNTMHAAATALGFKRFIQIYKTFSIYQTTSLMEAICRRVFDGPAISWANGIVASLQSVFDYLDEMSLVGTLDRLDQFLDLLAAEMDWPSVPPLQHVNEAPPSSRQQFDELLAMLSESERDPEVSLLLAIERAVYRKAQTLQVGGRNRVRARRRLSCPDAAFVAHDSAHGQIILGDNFAPAEPFGDGSPCWCTGNSQQSRIYVRIAGERRRLATQVRDWQFVLPAAMTAFVAGRQVPRFVKVISGSSRRLEIDLADAAPEGFVEIVIRMDWPGTPLPDSAPYYPRVALGKFEFA